MNISQNLKLSKKEKKDLFYIVREDLENEIKNYYNTDKFSEKLGKMIQKIAYGLSFATNYINYTYKDEMISDAINNMFKAIYKKNFNFNKVKCPNCEQIFELEFTESNPYPKPKTIKCPFCNKDVSPIRFSPFSYLTQIASFAFINRIKIENKLNDDKLCYVQKIYDDIMTDNPYYYSYIKNLESNENILEDE